MNKSHNKQFNCTMCGACCASVEATLKTISVPEEDKDFDFKIKEDGSCGHLTLIIRSDGTPGIGCGVYADRPTICRVGRHIPAYMTTDEYLDIVSGLCSDLQAAHGVPDTHRFKTE